MPRLSSKQERVVTELREALCAIEPKEEHPLTALMPMLARAIGAPAVGSYGIVPGAQHLDVEFTTSIGFASGTVDRFRALFASISRDAFFAINPTRVARMDRNVALRFADMTKNWGFPVAQDPTARRLLASLGVVGCDQLRVMVCEGPALLGWVGGFRDGKFDLGARRILGRVVPDLRRTLRLYREVADMRLLAAAAPVALDAIGAPAFVLSADGRVACANASGRALLAADGRGTQRLLSEAAMHPGRDPRMEVTPIRAPGLPERGCLVVIRARDGDSSARTTALAAALAASRALSPAQTRVLILVARGVTNASAAVTLDCSVKTIEEHMTRIFAKVGVSTRAALIAEVWTHAR